MFRGLKIWIFQKNKVIAGNKLLRALISLSRQELTHQGRLANFVCSYIALRGLVCIMYLYYFALHASIPHQLCGTALNVYSIEI